MSSVKESLELLDGVKVVLVAGKKVMADGKVNLQDLPVAVELLQKINVLVAAVDGIDKVPAEIKDIDIAELQLLGAKVIEIVQALRAVPSAQVQPAVNPA